jgi:hypothetical protein
MNTIKSKTVVFATLLLYVLLISSCHKDDSTNQPDNSSAQEVQMAVKNGSWQITYFFDSDHDETHHFTGYVFTFNPDGSLTAVKEGATVSGTWSVTQSNSNDDDGGLGDLDFNIFFAAPDDFADLSDDWDIIRFTSSKLELTDVSGGNGGIDYLTFAKL